MEIVGQIIVGLAGGVLGSALVCWLQHKAGWL